MAAAGEERPVAKHPRPYWLTHQWHASISPLADGLLDRLGSAGRRRKRLHRRLSRQAADLALANVENLRWFLLQRITEEGRHFRAALEERLAGAVALTHGAVKAVRQHRRVHAEETEHRTDRLRSTISRLERLQADIKRLDAHGST